MEYPYRIPFSTTKYRIFIWMCALFTLVLGPVCVAGFIAEESIASKVIISVVGVVFLSFFIFIMIFLTRRLRSGQLAFEVSDEGILDRTSMVTPALIRWEDITEIKTMKAHPQNIILVVVRDPEAYINAAGGSIRQNALRRNWRELGTPFAIDGGSFDISVDDITGLLQDELAFQQELRTGPGITLPELIKRREELLG